MLLRQLVCFAFAFALLKAGRIIAARTAMIAITTSSSIRVNARQRRSGSVRGPVCLGKLYFIILSDFGLPGAPFVRCSRKDQHAISITSCSRILQAIEHGRIGLIDSHAELIRELSPVDRNPVGAEAGGNGIRLRIHAPTEVRHVPREIQSRPTAGDGIGELW